MYLVFGAGVFLELEQNPNDYNSRHASSGDKLSKKWSDRFNLSVDDIKTLLHGADDELKIPEWIFSNALLFSASVVATIAGEFAAYPTSHHLVLKLEQIGNKQCL